MSVKSATRSDQLQAKDIESTDICLPMIDDYYRWAFEQAAHIRAGRFDQVDLLNVADEIEDVGKREFRSLTSTLEIILAHMLKWDFQRERRSRSWQASIEEHRERVLIDLQESPSMVSKRDLAIERAYRLARFRAAKETKMSRGSYSETCPYSWSQIMEAPYDLDALI